MTESNSEQLRSTQEKDAQQKNSQQRSSKKKLFACGFISALVAFGAINVMAIGSLTERTSGLSKETLSKSSEESSQEGTWSFWVARDYLMREKAPPVVMFGSSLIGSATFSADTQTTKNFRDCVVDRHAATLERDIKQQLGGRTEVYNASIPGSMASDAYLMSSALFKPDNKPQLVIIGVNPRDFIDNTVTAPADTEPFQFFSRYVSLGNLAKASFSDPFAYLDWTFHQYIPLKRMNAKLAEIASQISRIGQKPGEHPRTLVSHLNVKRSVMQVFLGGGKDIRKGEWLIPYPMPYGFQDNMPEYLNRYKNPKTALFPREKKFFNAFLAKLKDENIKVLVVNMPATYPNRSILPDTFWHDFKTYLSSTCTNYGADYIDLSDDFRFIITDYLDTVHLNASGGTRLFKIIAAKISSSPQLSAAALPQQVPAELRTNVQTSAVDNHWK
ncbi:MAG: hypothetical protein DKT66_07340 [Candidatus Melainabacteria bacterium]|nr:MAG: hypothetical protein DKT66_07340 [Candidatus Melainabacteria bacterium]